MIRTLRHWLAERLYWLAGKVEPRRESLIGKPLSEWPPDRRAHYIEAKMNVGEPVANPPNHMIYDPLHLVGDPVAPTSPWQGG